MFAFNYWFIVTLLVLQLTRFDPDYSVLEFIGAWIKLPL